MAYDFKREPFAEDQHLPLQATFKRMRPTAIIFDMDGVLIDSEPVHKLAKERAFGRFGITLPAEVYEQYKGRPDETMMNEVVPSIAQLKVGVQEMLRVKHLEFETVEHLARPIPGAKEFVTWAKTKFRIALATSATSRNRQAGLALLGLADCFDFVVDASGFTHPKPNPEIFHTALRGLNAKPNESLVIEDSLHGVIAGKAAGCQVIALTTSFADAQLRSKGADQVVQDFKELRALLQASSNGER